MSMDLLATGEREGMGRELDNKNLVEIGGCTDEMFA